MHVPHCVECANYRKREYCAGGYRLKVRDHEGKPAHASEEEVICLDFEEKDTALYSGAGRL